MRKLGLLELITEREYLLHSTKETASINKEHIEIIHNLISIIVNDSKNGTDDSFVKELYSRSVFSQEVDCCKTFFIGCVIPGGKHEFSSVNDEMCEFTDIESKLLDLRMIPLVNGVDENSLEIGKVRLDWIDNIRGDKFVFGDVGCNIIGHFNKSLLLYGMVE